MVPYDSEDRARIKNHIADRAGMGFDTLEISRNISSCITLAEKNGTFLVDSITALLLNELFPDTHSADADFSGVERCRRGLLEVAEKAENAVFVTDYIYSDAIRYDPFTENYRAALASLDRALAEVCDTVIELCAGNVVYHKGGLSE